MRPDGDPVDQPGQAAIAARYGVVRRSCGCWRRCCRCRPQQPGRELLQEIHRLPELLRRRISQKPLGEADLNMNLVTGTWRRAVLANTALKGSADRDAYVMCLLTQPAVALRRRDIFAYRSLRWGDPRARLLHGAESGVRRRNLDQRSCGWATGPTGPKSPKATSGVTVQLFTSQALRLAELLRTSPLPSGPPVAAADPEQQGK